MVSMAEDLLKYACTAWKVKSSNLTYQARCPLQLETEMGEVGRWLN